MYVSHIAVRSARCVAVVTNLLLSRDCARRNAPIRPSLLSVLPLQMLSWLVTFLASSSPQGIDQGVTLSALRVTLSALRVTAWVRVGPNLLGQGRVLSANKTARATFSRASRARSRELRAQRLRLIRALRTEFSLDNTIVVPML